MKKIRIGINGFGRIGRLVFRGVSALNSIEVVAINDLTSPRTLAHLLHYDSAQGRFDRIISSDAHSITVDGKTIHVYDRENPADIPWADHDVDVVIEATGFFTSLEKSTAHLAAGAKRVIISAPGSGEMKTIVFNVNHTILDGSEKIISCASCTTNCLAPMAKVLNDNFGIQVGSMTTVHAYTNDQNTLDSPHRKNDLRRARAAAANIIPNTTGAARALGLVLPELAGKLDGCSQRVPVITGSLTELTCILNRKVTVEEVNTAMRAAANVSFGYNADEIVSSDIIGMSYGSLFDATQTKVITAGDFQLVKTVAWYDNEMSYVSQLIRTVDYFAGLIAN